MHDAIDIILKNKRSLFFHHQSPQILKNWAEKFSDAWNGKYTSTRTNGASIWSKWMRARVQDAIGKYMINIQPAS